MSLEMQSNSGSKLALLNSLFKSNQVFNGNAREQFSAVAASIKADSQKLKDFNKVVGWQNNKILPPTWLQVAAMPLYMNIITAKTFPFSPLGLVHVENRVRLIKPLLSSERYEFTCHADNFRDHRKGQLFDLVTEARVSGELVYEAIATNLAFLKQKTSSENRGTENAVQEIGLVEEMAHFILASDIGRKYASVSGDYNLIHLASIPAKLFGFKRHIAHGMYLKAKALSTIQACGRLEDENTEIGIKFIKPVFLPGEATMFLTTDADNLVFSLESKDRSIIHCKGLVCSLNVSG